MIPLFKPLSKLSATRLSTASRRVCCGKGARGFRYRMSFPVWSNTSVL